MLAHLKAKRRDPMPPEDEGKAKEPPIMSQAPANIPSAMTEQAERIEHQVTCDALCSLGTTSSLQPSSSGSGNGLPSTSTTNEKGRKAKACPKQHQLPMFLTKTYHMIDRCDPEIATWSTTGDNFVVKNVEKFSGCVLPQYFKHSNFSSFARQLNFYGFRKLKAEPILTADFDARTACYVRFYHEKFQKDRPDLLASIKRATKADQQSKDEVESLRAEQAKLKECITNMAAEYDRRINNLAADYDRLAVLVQQMLAANGNVAGMAHTHTSMAHAHTSTRMPDMMHSLSQVAAYSLQTLRPPATHQASVASVSTLAGTKRPTEEEDTKPTARAKTE